MLSSRQGSWPFHEWVVNVQTQNSILINDTAHMTDGNLRYHFEAHMHKDLANEYRTLDTKDEADLCRWIEKVKKLDEKQLQEARSLRDQIEASLRASGKPRTYDERHPPTDPSGPHAPKPPSSGMIRLPGLTDKERKLLRDNEGCFKC